MMSILPVKIWSQENGRVVETYAFLDGGSSATFCSRSLLKQLGVAGEGTKISMTTASVEDQEVESRVVKGVQISDLDGNGMLSLPDTFTLNSIPVKHSDIATARDLDQWIHLQGITLPCIDAEIGLLIGSNCPQALQPLEIRTGRGGGPFAFGTSLGWVVQGPRSRCLSAGRQVKVNIVEVGEMALNDLLVDMYNREFPENHSVEEKSQSEDDRRWVRKVTTRCTQQSDGHYVIPLPLRQDSQVMPNNKICALRRLTGLKNRLQKDPKFTQHYCKFMEDMLQKGYAEKVPQRN